MNVLTTGAISTHRIARQYQELAERHLAGQGHMHTIWSKLKGDDEAYALRCDWCGAQAVIEAVPGVEDLPRMWVLRLIERDPGSACRPISPVCRARVDRTALGGKVRKVFSAADAAATAGMVNQPDPGH